MGEPSDDYDPRYLAGILLFNARDFFEAHDVWEELWADCRGPEQRYYQGLIQAAVGLFHYSGGNVRGTAKLYRSSRAYMEPYGSPYLGLDVSDFWARMGRCFAPVLACADPDRDLRPDAALVPTIALDPPPRHWPDPEQFLREEDDEAMSDGLSVPGAFDGKARLFPLPNLVLFPHVIQPLHIFEPRYRQMTADALAGDRLISIVLLRPGWEDDYDGRPPVHRVGCLGKVVADQRLEEGTYNLLLRGLRRVRVVEELPADRLYRTARVELLHDDGALDADAALALRARLAEQLRRWLPPGAAAAEQFRKLLESDLSPGALCDVFGFALPLDVALKQQLLEELDVAERARRLVAMLRDSAPPAAAPTGQDRKFPPEFSAN